MALHEHQRRGANGAVKPGDLGNSRCLLCTFVCVSIAGKGITAQLNKPKLATTASTKLLETPLLSEVRSNMVIMTLYQDWQVKNLLQSSACSTMAQLAACARTH